MKEGGQEAWPGANTADRTVEIGAQVPVVLRTQVRELVALQVAPDVLVGIEFGTVGWQVVDGDAGTLDEESPGCGRGVRAQAVPDQLDGTANVSEQMADETDGVSAADGVAVELEVEPILSVPGLPHPWPPGDRADGRGHAPIALAVPQDGRHTTRRPCARHVRGQSEAALIGEDDGRAALDSPLLMRGQSRSRQRWALRLLRSRACRSGRCHDQPSIRSRDHTCPGQYRTPKTSCTTFATRDRVHKSVPKPNACGPAISIFGSSARSISGGMRGLGPRPGCVFTPRMPPALYRPHHFLTASRLTPKWRATSAWLHPFFSSRMPSSRRHSRAFVLDSFFGLRFKGACSHHPPAVNFLAQVSMSRHCIHPGIA